METIYCPPLDIKIKQSFLCFIISQLNQNKQKMFGKVITHFKKHKIALITKNRYLYYNEVPKFDPKKDYYQILQVTKQANESEVKKSYYRLAKTYHPDSNPGKESQFKEINEAYSVLSDLKLKKAYNSARSFQGFSRRMGSKAKQGAYNPNEYKSMYQNLSDQERDQILQQMRMRLRKIMIFGLAFVIIVPLFTRRNHQFYVFNNGELMPVEFQGGMAGGTLPPPGMIDPYGRPPTPQYQNQPNYQGGQPYQGGNTYQNKQFNPQAQQYQNNYQTPPQGPPQSNPYQGYQSPYQSPNMQNYRSQTNLQPGYQGPMAPN